MKHKFLAASAAALSLLTMATSTAAADSASGKVTERNIDQLLLAPDDVGEILGTQFPYAAKTKRPFKDDSLTGPKECTSLLTQGKSFFGPNLKQYRLGLLRDTEDKETPPDYLVFLNAASYADPATAKAALTSALRPTSKCDGVYGYANGNGEFQFHPPKISGSKATWSIEALYDGDPFGWACFQNFRAVSNAIVGVQLCQMGNGSASAAEIADQMIGQLGGAT